MKTNIELDLLAILGDDQMTARESALVMLAVRYQATERLALRDYDDRLREAEKSSGDGWGSDPYDAVHDARDDWKNSVAQLEHLLAVARSAR